MTDTAANSKGSDLPSIQFERVDKPGRRSSEYRSIYVNSTKAGLSPWDIRFILGQVVEDPDTNEQVQEDMVTVVMSPQHAKVFAEAIQTTVTMYEAQFGIIPTDAITKRLSEIKKSPKKN